MKSLLLLFLLTVFSHAVPAWNYPAIPYTDWEYDPFTYGPPPTPGEWPSSGSAGTYRIEPDNPLSSDSVAGSEPVDENGNRYGYPDRPRLTLPLASKNLNTFPAGVVFWMKGGTYNTMYGTGAIFNLSCISAPEAPFRIYGDPTDRPTLTGGRFNFQNACYGFVDNIVWEEDTKGAGCIDFGGTFSAGQTHHIAIRNCEINNRKFFGNGSFIGMASRDQSMPDSSIHDIVCYKIKFYACGYGITWDSTTVDPDMHGYKINGSYDTSFPLGYGLDTATGGNRVYRIWIIENSVLPGDYPDPIDGYYKGMAGSFVQLGDQKPDNGNTDHVYMAGCYVKGIRQSTCGFKRSSHCISSSNVTVDTVRCLSAQGQAYNFKYDRQDSLWVVNNYVARCDAFVIRAETTMSRPLPQEDTFDKTATSVYIIGNIFRDCMRLPFADPDLGGIGGRKSKGICVQDFNGKVYIMNNVVDTSPYGVYFGTAAARSSVGSEMHVYNNVFTNITAGPDTSEVAGNGIGQTIQPQTSAWFIENNFTENGRNFFGRTQYTDNAGFNARPEVAGQLSGDPMFTDASTEDYTILEGSPLIAAGITETTLAPGSPVDIYELFVAAFDDDPDYPGDPRDYWPRDFAGNSRLVAGNIDIGAYGYGSLPVPVPDPVGPGSGGGSITTGTLITDSLIITP